MPDGRGRTAASGVSRWGEAIRLLWPQTVLGGLAFACFASRRMDGDIVGAAARGRPAGGDPALRADGRAALWPLAARAADRGGPGRDQRARLAHGFRASRNWPSVAGPARTGLRGTDHADPPLAAGRLRGRSVAVRPRRRGGHAEGCAGHGQDHRRHDRAGSRPGVRVLRQRVRRQHLPQTGDAGSEDRRDRGRRSGGEVRGQQRRSDVHLPHARRREVRLRQAGDGAGCRVLAASHRAVEQDARRSSSPSSASARTTSRS